MVVRGLSWRVGSALVGLVAIGCVVFRGTLFDTATQIGNSDRLNHMLANLVFHVRGLRAGGVRFWDDTMLGGLNTFGLDFNPFSFLYLLLPEHRLIALSALGSLVLFVLSGVAAFQSLRSMGASVFAAFVGAGLYQTSGLTVLQVMQHDFTASVLVIIPLMMAQIRAVAPVRLLRPFVIIAATLWFMMTFLFLQSVCYALLLFGAFATYLTLSRRDWRFVLVYGAAGLVALLGAMPRLWTVVGELAVLSRSSSGIDDANFAQIFDFQNIRFVEILRLLDDGIFGRFPSEAATMGNNINLTEGMLLHTSVLALVILAGGLLYRRVGIEAWRKDRHGWFMAAVLVLTLSIIVLWPVRYVAYLLFAHSDMVHARVAVIALFPLVALVAGVLDRWTGGIAVPTIWRTPLETAGIVLVAAGMVFLADRSAVASAPALSAVKFAIPSHLLDPPWTWFTAEAPRAPTDVSATRRSPDQARLSWRPVTGAMGYFVELGLNGGPSAPVGFAPAAARFYDLGSLDRTATYDLRLAACNVRGCSDRLEGTLPIEPGAVADMRDRLPPPVPGVPLPDNHLYDSHLRIDILVLTRVLILSCIAVGLMAVAALSPRRWRVVAGILGIAAVIDASTAANFQINGPQTRWVGPAFQGGNMMTAAAGEFRSPSEASLKAAAQRLETGAYRSVAVCSPVTFATFCAPHLSHFWNLRLLDGYTAGVPRGLAAVPWPDGVREMRSLTFRDADALAWRWLALFNVKYAILASRSLYTNGDARQVLDPTTIPVLENPLPVVPRLFFAAAAERVPDAETAITRLAAGTAPADPRRISYAVGLAAATYEDRGRIDGVFAADRVEIHLDPAAAARFLVINEQPHPGWQATADGRAIPVYSVNGAMRGVVVPAGATTVTLVFRPFAVTAGALPFLLASVGLLVAGIVVCRRGERLALPAS